MVSPCSRLQTDRLCAAQLSSSGTGASYHAFTVGPVLLSSCTHVCNNPVRYLQRDVSRGGHGHTAKYGSWPDAPFAVREAGSGPRHSHGKAHCQQVNHASALVSAARLGDISFAVCLKQGRQVGDALAYANATVGVCHTHGIGARVVNDLLMGACDVIVCG